MKKLISTFALLFIFAAGVSITQVASAGLKSGDSCNPYQNKAHAESCDNCPHGYYHSPINPTCK